MEPEPPNSLTWTEYQKFSGDKRWEAIEGHLFAMTSPTVLHQRICTELTVLLHQHFRGRPCQVFVSPLDVRLSEESFVQPDILVVCNPEQLAGTHVEGAPHLVVEVLSPSTLRHDRVRKVRLYAQAGVQEYWLVQPYPGMVEVLYLDGATYRLHASYFAFERLVSPSFPELEVDLCQVFPEQEVEEIRETLPPFLVASLPE